MPVEEAPAAAKSPLDIANTPDANSLTQVEIPGEAGQLPGVQVGGASTSTDAPNTADLAADLGSDGKPHRPYQSPSRVPEFGL